MKRIVCILSVLFVLFFLCSCNKKAENENSNSRPVVVLPEGSKETVTVDTSSSDNSSRIVSSDPENMIYVGNKNSKIFHKETCKSISNMKSENMISFETIDEALNSDYKPCGICLK